MTTARKTGTCQICRRKTYPRKLLVKINGITCCQHPSCIQDARVTYQVRESSREPVLDKC